MTDAAGLAQPEESGARAQLEALAAASAQAAASGAGAGLFDRLRPPLDGGTGRPAAVLILFGVLDRLPADHDARAEAVSRDLDVLLLQRATTLRAHPGQVAFPGGRIDPGDSDAVACALREAEEETGVDPSGIDVLGGLGQVPLERSRHLVTPVLAWWRQPSRVGVVDVAESAAVFRAPVADLLNPANRGSTVMRRGDLEPRGPAFEIRSAYGDHLVWGFTAMLLDALFDRLGWTEPWDRRRIIPLEG